MNKKVLLSIFISLAILAAAYISIIYVAETRSKERTTELLNEITEETNNPQSQVGELQELSNDSVLIATPELKDTQDQNLENTDEDIQKSEKIIESTLLNEDEDSSPLEAFDSESKTVKNLAITNTNEETVGKLSYDYTFQFALIMEITEFEPPELGTYYNAWSRDGEKLVDLGEVIFFKDKSLILSYNSEENLTNLDEFFVTLEVNDGNTSPGEKVASAFPDKQ